MGLVIILVIFQALDYVNEYEEYSSVWTNDQTKVLPAFLKYGRDLTTEEMETLQYQVDAEGEPLMPPTPPKLSDFQTKVRVFIVYIFE